MARDDSFREMAEKINLWVAYDVPGRRKETYRDIENALRAAYSQGVEDSKKAVVDYRQMGRYKTGHGFMSNLDEVAMQINALKPPSEK